MSSLYLDKWERKLSGAAGYAIAVAIFLFFMVYEYAVISRARADSFLRQGRARVQKARVFSDTLLVEKSLLYQESLVSFKRSIASNPLSPAPYYEYAQTLLEIGSSPLLRKSVNPQVVGVDTDRQEEFYSKALRYYRYAVLWDPFCGIYHQRLGDVYARLLDYGMAEKEFDAALLVDADNISIHLYLTYYFSMRTEREKYEYHLNKVISLYNATLKGGGPLSDMVRAYFKSINREDLLQ